MDIEFSLGNSFEKYNFVNFYKPFKSYSGILYSLFSLVGEPGDLPDEHAERAGSDHDQDSQPRDSGSR